MNYDDAIAFLVLLSDPSLDANDRTVMSVSIYSILAFSSDEKEEIKESTKRGGERREEKRETSNFHPSILHIYAHTLTLTLTHTHTYTHTWAASHFRIAEAFSSRSNSDEIK